MGLLPSSPPSSPDRLGVTEEMMEDCSPTAGWLGVKEGDEGAECGSGGRAGLAGNRKVAGSIPGSS